MDESKKPLWPKENRAGEKELKPCFDECTQECLLRPLAHSLFIKLEKLKTNLQKQK